MFAICLLIALAKKKVNKFTPVPTPKPHKKANKFTPAPEPQQNNYYEEREVHYYHHEQPRQVQRETVIIDSTDDMFGDIAVVIGIILVGGVMIGACCGSKSTTEQQQPLEQVVRVETVRTIEQPVIAESTISWHRYNEVINDSATTANDYNALLTNARNMIHIADQYGIPVKHIPKKLDHFMSTARYKTVMNDVTVTQFNEMVENNRKLNESYNKLVDISNAAETTLINNHIRF